MVHVYPLWWDAIDVAQQFRKDSPTDTFVASSYSNSKQDEHTKDGNINDGTDPSPNTEIVNKASSSETRHNSSYDTDVYPPQDSFILKLMVSYLIRNKQIPWPIPDESTKLHNSYQ